ncbi:cytochrome c oxidase subunit II [Novosphingobium flavum]|uniref:cytochrome-c oxidase n=1 Tax=Novosphingobium flavum TaxID=1778672 RepID=A0A7X1FR70_9SPHN|nr:cytochrome c oxidase subunit II [Novosphingobium flavum]MBC2665461.1 cytochrome c oxidase subunit II [Novosphingobium flavum]
MPVAIAIVVLVIGSIAFHWLSPWWQTPLAADWGSIDSALRITIAICAVVFVLLNLFLAYSLWRFRHRPGRRARFEPENAALEKGLTFWTAVGIAAMLAPGLVAWGRFVTIPKDAAVVEAVGQQWQWSFRFPGADRALGTAAVQYMTPENPLGLNPNDPFGRDDIIVEASELHLPVGEPVKMVLRSKDVLHDFYVPEFRAKMDLVPGMVTYFWMKPTRAGKYDILCAELCGSGHYVMRGSVIVESRKAFDAWLSGQQAFGQTITGAAPEVNAAAPAHVEGGPATGHGEQH